MKQKLFITFLTLFLSRFAYAQTCLDSLYAAIAGNDDGKAAVIIQKMEQNYQQMKEEEKCDFLYLKGTFIESKGNVDDALECFQESVEIADGLRRYDQSYYDAILRIMMWNKEKESYYECAKYGLEAVKTPTENQKQYPSIHLIYSTLTGAMLYAGLFADVPEMVVKGLPFREQLKKDDDEYYALPYSEVVAWLMMGNVEKAEEVYDKLYQDAKTGSSNLQSALPELHQQIVEAKKEGWDERKARMKNHLDKMAESLLLVDPLTTEGRLLWEDYFSSLRHQLEFFYYDTSSPKDEELWNSHIANMIVRFFVICDGVPGMESVAYDNILCRKNFLNYHFGNRRKKPATWTDVRDALEDNEVAIEVLCVPDEILLIRKNAQQPICTPIDSLLFEDIARLNVNEPLAIDSLYSKDGPLTKLWNLIEQSLKPNERTLYISGSNIFQTINYGAILLHEGGIVSDRYEVHNMLSTSDVMEVKQNKKRRIQSAFLMGGVDYDDSSKPKKGQSVTSKDEVWNFSPFLPQRMRSGFHDLPKTLKEVENVGNMMDSIGIAKTVKTGKDATEEFFKGISNNSPDIIHLATHGFMLAPLFNDTTGQRLKDQLGTQYQTVLSQSGLLLAGGNKKWSRNVQQEGNDGILSSKEIASLNLANTRLAVLMACRSGLGETTNLTGVPFGVAYAFKMAGVNQILCCLWEVDDDVTAEMNRCFYKNLFKTNDARKALELARKDLMGQGLESPFYWAPFILVE